MSLSSKTKTTAIFLSLALVPRVGAQTRASPFPVLGAVNLQEGRWNEVPDLFLHLSRDPKSEDARSQLWAAAGEQYFVQGLLEESRDAFQKLLKAKRSGLPMNNSSFTWAGFFLQTVNLRMAEILLLEHQPDQALKLLEPLTHDTNPYIADEALLLVTRCHLYKHQWEKVEEEAVRLIKQNPAYARDLSLNLLRGVAALEQGDFERANTFFARFPDEPAALYYRGVSLIQQKDLSKAIPIYQEILKSHARTEWPDRMRLVLGEAFYQARDWELASQFFAPITRPQASSELRVLALHRQACLFFHQKKFERCEQILMGLLKTFPDHPLRSQWTYLYVSVPIYKKDWKKAIQEQKEALEMERGLAPKIFGVDEAQLRLSAQFRILWAHLLLNDFNGTLRLADSFMERYPKTQITPYAYLAKGLSYYRLGEYDRAIEVYQELLNKFPQSSAGGKAVYLMTLCLHSARDPFRVAGILHQVHERVNVPITPGEGADEWTQNTLYWIADAYYQINDYVTAEKIYREFLLKAPQSQLAPYALAALGQTFSAQGPNRDPEAVIALQQALLRANELQQKELAERAEVELAKVYYNMRKFDKAAETWDHVVRVSTQTAVKAESVFRKADALVHQHLYEDAILSWKQLAQNHKETPWIPETLWRMGNTQMGLGQWPEANETFKTLIKAYPANDLALQAEFQLVTCAFNQGDFTTAGAELLLFAKRHPDDSRIPEVADNLLRAIHQHQVFLPTDEQAKLMKLAPGSAGGAAILWERAASLYNEQKYELAQKFFEKIMLSYPNDEHASTAYFYNAECLFSLKRWDEGVTGYQNFFVSFPNHEKAPEAMFQKAVCLFKKGSYEEAVTDFEAFMKKFPKHPLVKDAWLNIALSYKKAFRLDKAVQTYRRVLELYGPEEKMNAVWLQLGALLEVQGKRPEALQSYAQVALGTPEYPEGLYRRAVLLEQDQQGFDARKLYEELRTWPERKNEFRVAALIKLTEIYEQENVPMPELKALYKDLQISSSDPEVVKLAGERLKELGK